MPPFITPAAEEELRQAVASVEAASSAELVVMVRPKSADYRHVDLGVGMAMAFVTLAFVVYSPWPFAWHFLLGLPIVVGLGITHLSSHLPALQRKLSKQERMRDAVRKAAQAAFVEAGVHHTEYRTGVLIYVSQLESCVELVADSGVELAFPPKDWGSAAKAIAGGVRAGAGASELASAIESTGELFAKHLPPRDGDQNELEDGVIQ